MGNKKTKTAFLILFIIIFIVIFKFNGNDDEFVSDDLMQSGERLDSAPMPARIFLISIDTLRPDRLDLYGYYRDTAAILAGFGSECTVFTNAGAQATQTLVSHKSMFSGKYPLHLLNEVTNAGISDLEGVKKTTAYLTNGMRKADSGRLVKRMKARGYETAAFVDGGWLKKIWGFGKGFEKYNSKGGGFEEILPRAESWLLKNGSGPFFLFLHTYDVHCPYACREPFNSKYCPDHSIHIDLEGKCPKTDLKNVKLRKVDYDAISNHYDGGISSMDDLFSGFIAFLRENELYDESLMVIISDHGESLGEEKRLGHGGLHPEQIFVPVMIKFPASMKIPPDKIGTPVELCDVMPTILDICGMKLPDDLDGRSLLPLIKGKKEEFRKFIVTQTTFNEWEDGVSHLTERSVLEPGKWFLVNDSSVASTKLFDLQRDPKCLDDVSDREENIRDALLGFLKLFDPGESTGNVLEPEQTEIPDDVKEHLKSLGDITE